MPIPYGHFPLDDPQRTTPMADAIWDIIHKVPPEHREAAPGHNGMVLVEETLKFVGRQFYEADCTTLFTTTMPNGTVMEQAEKLIGQLYGASARIVTTGASMANWAMCASLAQGMKGRTWFVQWNVHVSILNWLKMAGVKVRRLKPQLHPTLGCATVVTAEELQAAIDEALKAGEKLGPVILNWGTYEGYVTDPAVVTLAHKYELKVGADDSWLSYMEFGGEGMALSGLMAGADMSTRSWHKTTGVAVTQIAVVLRLLNGLVDEDAFEVACANTSTTSESVPLLAITDHTRKYLANDAPTAIKTMYQLIDDLAEHVLKPRGLYLDINDEIRAGTTAAKGWNKGMVVVPVWQTGYNGFEIAKILKERGFKVKANLQYVVLVTGLGVHAERGLWNTVEALVALMDELQAKGYKKPLRKPLLPPLGKRYINLANALYAETELVDLADIAGEIVMDEVGLYPPGFGAIWPGDRASKKLVKYILWALEAGADLYGTPRNDKIRILKRTPPTPRVAQAA
jgi:arginine/lysine/ornithine decarboxylase